MHIPDGFLTNRVALSLDVLSGATILYAARRTRMEASTRVIPIMGVLGAFVFTAQMLNFPVLGGTSGHLVGGALLAILLGPTAAFLTMATVIIAQALFLQDGGVIALGANIFNICAVTSFGGYAIFRLLGGANGSRRRMALASFCAGWGSLMFSAVCCALQLGLSGAIPWRIGLPAMTVYHAVIGIVEGGLTAGVLSFLLRVRPDLVRTPMSSRLGWADWAGGLILVAVPALILVLAGSSALPDPLESLLKASPMAEAPVDFKSLLAPERFRDYLWHIVIFALLVVGAIAVAHIVHRRKGHA